MTVRVSDQFLAGRGDFTQMIFSADLMMCCSLMCSSLELNTLETVEMLVRSSATLPALNRTVMFVKTFSLNWDSNINFVTKRDQQRMYFL